MLNKKMIGKTQSDPLPPWPPVNLFRGFGDEFKHFLSMSKEDMRQHLGGLRPLNEKHGEFIMRHLGTIYAHWFGYPDGPPITEEVDPDMELELLQAKLVLEQEMLVSMIPYERTIPDHITQSTESTVMYLTDFVQRNSGVGHEFYEYVASEMSLAEMNEFLRMEVTRNEIVDDEVALMVPGHQHSMKQVLISNLWDEGGNGKLDGFHTNWLRKLLNATNGWTELYEYRKRKPWFCDITSNSFNTLLTHPGDHFAAYGHFLVTEAWVCPHFRKIVAGMERLGLTDPNIQVYFTAHIDIDPHHAAEMLEGIRNQQPSLPATKLSSIILGSRQAAAAGVAMYDRLLNYFKRKEK
jgi:hypothetical protein